MLPADEELSDDPRHLRFKGVNANGTIRIAEKDEMKQRRKRSPDRADARMLASAQLPQGRPSRVGCAHKSDGDLAEHPLVQRVAASAA